jgi:hypothetical protein
MRVEEAQATVARLKAAYPSAKALDEITTDLYTETLSGMDSRDVFPACKAKVGMLKFFPSIAEITENVNAFRVKRLAAAESQDREKRLAGDVMDPKAEIHRKVVGPNHARFLRILRGEEELA